MDRSHAQHMTFSRGIPDASGDAMTADRATNPRSDDRLRAASDDYVRRVRIACDDLYDDPFSASARAALRALLAGEEESPTQPVARVRRSA